MGGNQLLLLTIVCLALPIYIDSAIPNDPKDEVEFVNPFESGINKAAAASEADDMNKPPVNTNNVVPSELVITTSQNMPFSGTRMVNGTLVGEGYAFYFFDLLRAKMNFTYKIVLPKQPGLGDTTSGIIGQLVRKEVDMVVAFLPVLPELRKVIKYSTGLDEVEWTIMMKRPSESATGSGLLAPFDTTVWILIILSVLAVGPIIYTIIFLRFTISKDGEARKYSLATCMWFVYGALLKQGSTLSPVTDSARLLFATWWIFITILTSFYTANLTAFLTLSQFTLPINTADDLANKNQKWFARQGDAIERIVSEKNNGELDMLQRSVQKGYGEFLTLDEKDNNKVLELVKQNKMYVRERPHVTELLFNDYMKKTRNGVAEETRCTFVIAPGNIIKKSMAFAFPINSTLDVPFNKRLIALVETGLIREKISEHLPGTEICPLNLGSTERQLRNSDLTMTYKGMGIGFIIAVMAFVTEVIYLRLIKRKPIVENPAAAPAAARKLPVYKFDDSTKGLQRSPPPLYQNTQDYSKKQFINGRDYYVVRERDGEKRLVPVRTPSAYLFQYAA